MYDSVKIGETFPCKGIKSLVHLFVYCLFVSQFVVVVFSWAGNDAYWCITIVVAEPVLLSRFDGLA